MEIRYTRHAEERLWQRGISKRMVRVVILRGNRSNGGASLSINGKNVIVIYKIMGKDQYLIITAYYGGN